MNNGHMPNQSNVGDLTNVAMPNTPSSNANPTPNGRRNNRNNPNSTQCVINGATAVKTSIARYNRRNNPELEKRRIHHCDFLGNVSISSFSFLYLLLLLLHDLSGCK